MTRALQSTDDRDSELAVFVTEAVEQAMVRHGQPCGIAALLPVTKIADIVGAAITFLPHAHRQAIEVTQDQLSGLTLRFILSLAGKTPHLNQTGTDDSEVSFPLSSEMARPDIAKSNIAKPETGSFDIRGEKSGFESMLVEDWAGPVAGQTFLEKNLCIPRSTLHWWQRRNDVVALRKGGRKHVFPLAQFVDGRPAAGIRDVLSHIVNPRLAWFWLARPSPLLDGRVPIEMLKQDLVAEVVLAARDFAQD